MPDITTLPLLVEIFGVSIDDLFDLTAEQRLNRIENRMDLEKELPQDVFRELVQKNPEAKLAYAYLLDNLLADRRAAEAEQVLERYAALPDVNPIHVGVYRAHLALARFDEPTADRIMEELGEKYRDDFVYLFEAAQYYAGKCDYDRAIALYERSFELETHRPRFQDELMEIAEIQEIRGDYPKAAETWGRIVDLLENEWGFTEEVGLQEAKEERARLLAKAN